MFVTFPGGPPETFTCQEQGARPAACPGCPLADGGIDATGPRTRIAARVLDRIAAGCYEPHITLTGPPAPDPPKTLEFGIGEWGATSRTYPGDDHIEYVIPDFKWPPKPLPPPPPGRWRGYILKIRTTTSLAVYTIGEETSGCYDAQWPD